MHYPCVGGDRNDDSSSVNGRLITNQKFPKESKHTVDTAIGANKSREVVLFTGF